MPKPESNRYIRFYGPILDALRKLGGSGTPTEVKAEVIASCQISEDELDQTLKGGVNRVQNEIHWARDYLRRLGLIDGTVKGVWTLTEKGLTTKLTLAQARELRRQLYLEIAANKPKLTHSTESLTVQAEEEEIPLDTGQAGLFETLMTLPPSGFEKLCMRLLRESGFLEVKVTGKSGDGGIDGHGILQINELVSFRVVFQCKRYTLPVGPGLVRDFRGGVGSSDDKAIMITTATYTTAARAEAVKPGLAPIELVDGERLVELMQRLGLGVTPRTVYDVDPKFFEEFR